MKKKNILINFDAFRKTLAPIGVNPFTHDENIRKMIYKKAAKKFSKYLNQGFNLVIDCGLSKEKIRKQLKSEITQLKICHVYCPLLVCILRETNRSIFEGRHENGNYLYLRAIASRLFKIKKEKSVVIPPFTHTFDYPRCADIRVSSFLNSPDKIANYIINELKI